MLTIEAKLAKVLPTAIAAGFTESETRHLIHGTGGSPRRAKRLLKTDIETARAMAQAFREGIEAGIPFRTLLAQAQAAWPALGGSATEAPEGGEGEEEGDPEGAAVVAELPPAPTKRTRRGKAKPVAAAAAELALL